MTEQTPTSVAVPSHPSARYNSPLPALVADFVVLGGGLVGVELGIHMAQQGHGVSIVEMLPELSVDPYSMHTIALNEQIEKLGINVYTSTAVTEITPDGVEIAEAGWFGRGDLPPIPSRVSIARRLIDAFFTLA